jgi:hypothetical protein
LAPVGIRPTVFFTRVRSPKEGGWFYHKTLKKWTPKSINPSRTRESTYPVSLYNPYPTVPHKPTKIKLQKNTLTLTPFPSLFPTQPAIQRFPRRLQRHRRSIRPDSQSPHSNQSSEQIGISERESRAVRFISSFITFFIASFRSPFARKTARQSIVERRTGRWRYWEVRRNEEHCWHALNRAFADFVLGSLILHFFCVNFINWLLFYLRWVGKNWLGVVDIVDEVTGSFHLYRILL